MHTSHLETVYPYKHPRYGTNICSHYKIKYPYSQVSAIIRRGYQESIPPSSKDSPYFIYYQYARSKGWLPKIKAAINANKPEQEVDLSKLDRAQRLAFKRLHKRILARMSKRISPNHPDNDPIWKEAAKHRCLEALKRSFNLSARHKYGLQIIPIPAKYRKEITQAMSKIDANMAKGFSPTHSINDSIWAQASHFRYLNHLRQQYFLSLTHKTKATLYTQEEIKQQLAQALQEGYRISDLKSPYQKYYQYASRQGWLKQLRQELNLPPSSRS